MQRALDNAGASLPRSPEKVNAGAIPASGIIPSAEAGTSSRFSDFIRNATEEEKRAVYEDVMRRATERQNAKVASSETGDRDAIIEECAGMVDEYNDQNETGDLLSQLADNMRALKNALAVTPPRPDARDSTRYRWLRTYWRRVVSHAEGERITWMSLHSDNTIATNEESVDAAIDKAMEEARHVRR